MDKVKIGVIGLGWVAQVVHLPILSQLQDAEIVAVCDRDRSRAKLVGEKFGVKRTYADAEQMLANEGLDCVIVATSTDAHREAAAHMEVMKQLRQRAMKRHLMVGMNHRFRPDTMLLKSFIESKELGKLFYAKTAWLRRRSSVSPWVTQKEKSGGGVFIDLGIVMLDLALWLMGYPDVRRVSATNFHHKTKQVEDTSLVTIALKTGSLVNIEVSWSMIIDDDVYYYYLFGSEGTASLNPLRVNKELHGSLVNLAPARMEPPQHLFKQSYENELKHFLGAVRNIHPVISTAEEAVQRMKTVDAVYKSARTGKEVLFP